MSNTIAILISDIHLSWTAPRFRADEPNWLHAQNRILQEIEEIRQEYDCPIFCAGDIFHKWNANSELINFAIQYLPKRMYCVPGQHDLPFHNYNEMLRSAYGTLVLAGTIENIEPDKPQLIPAGFVTIDVDGFPWGEKLRPPKVRRFGGKTINLAVAHHYIWKDGKSYPGADPKDNVDKVKRKLEGFDVALFGDNHKPFLSIGKNGFPTIYNHGALIRRNATEEKTIPTVGLLQDNGTVKLRKLTSASKDVFSHAPDNTVTEYPDSIRDFVASISQSKEMQFNFRAEVERFIRTEKPDTEVSQWLRNMLEES